MFYNNNNNNNNYNNYNNNNYLEPIIFLAISGMIIRAPSKCPSIVVKAPSERPVIINPVGALTD